jgi:tetratricopeptide (TPR) repeat protein
VRLDLSQGNLLDAAINAQELVQKYPGDENDRELLSGVLARQGKLKEAEAENVVAVQLAPNDPVAHVNLGQDYAAEKKWPEAQKEFDSALQLDPHNSNALWQMTNSLIARNQAPVALARTRQFVTANPDDENGHVIFGMLDTQSKDYASAQTELGRALEINPKSFQSYLQLGRLYEAQGQTDRAIESYQKALDLQPKLAQLATYVGNFYLKKQDLQTAQKYFTQALDSDPNFAVANANLAWVDAQEGKNLDVALGMAQKAKSLLPDTPSITDTLAWVLYKRGNYAGAIPLLEECVRKSPDSGEFHYHLGMALLGSGSKTRAHEQITAALRLALGSNDEREARQALAQLN